APSRDPGAQVVRGFGLLGSTVLLIVALKLLPMAEATALVFVSPAFATALSFLLLGERIKPGQWLAVAGGLIGVLIILRPGFQEVSSATLLP
ncbi:EamA family transporter, partial [Acinetobacter baumannii]|uniref:EamA family transporter n=1 Tax=Acinetobacter baumannii TaxID=470 RepID=UPI0013D85226